MRNLNRDTLPHLFSVLMRIILKNWFAVWAHVSVRWWGVDLGNGGSFMGKTRFYRHPGSYIRIGSNCKFNSTPNSNLIGINRPCMISTLKNGAELTIGEGCGFSGTVIACACRITLGRNVRCVKCCCHFLSPSK